MTEGLGLAIGCLGFALLWRSGVRRHQTLALIGFGLMAFAMLVRTGAVFILPLLLLWGAFVFARRSRWISVPFLAIGTIITLGASFYNSVISRYVSEGEYISFGNYSYVLYGILKGGSWLLIFQDHPEITGDPNLPLSDKYDLIYQMCFEIIQNDPMALVRGVFRAWTMLFSHGVPAHFTESLFFGIATPSLIWTMKWVFYPLMGLGLLGCLWFWRHPLHSLILAMVVGIFLSSALAPIWDTGLRAYAATMPTGYILMALGFWFLIQGLLWLNNWFRISRWLTIPLQDFVWPIESSPLLSFQKEVQEKNKDFPFHLTIWSSILLVFLSAVLPVLIKAITPRSQYLAASCPAGQEARVVYYHPHAIVNLVPDDQISVSKIPNLKISDFYEGLSIFKRLKNPIGDTLSVLQPGQTIIYIQGFDNIVAPTSMVPEKPGHYTICGQKVFTSQAEPRMKFVFTVFASYSFHPIQQTDKPLETSVVLPAGLKAI